MKDHPRHRIALFACVAGAVLVGVGGLAGATLVRSPAERAAGAAPPAPSVLTAPVEFRVLADTVVLRGTVTAGNVIELAPATSDEGGVPVVTEVRKEQGDEVAAGEVIIEVSGRPVFALPGDVPVYRDLRPGSSGDDVAQLQRALRNLGHDVDAIDGLFGEETKSAVERFYVSIGYEAPTTGDEEAVAAAEETVTAAERNVEDARRALEDAKNAMDATDPQERGTPDPVVEAELALTRATEDLARARKDLDELVSRSGVIVPASELVFLPTFPGRVSVLNARVGSTVVESPLLTLSSGELVVQSRLSPMERDLMEPGLPVEILSEVRGVTALGTIASIGELSEDEDAGLSHPVTITAEQPLDPELVGEDVRLTVQAASTEEPVLIVPLAAVSAGADGRTTVTRLAANGRERRVLVTAGVSADGFVQVTPADSGALHEGDRVVVGR